MLCVYVLVFVGNHLCSYNPCQSWWWDIALRGSGRVCLCLVYLVLMHLWKPMEPRQAWLGALNTCLAFFKNQHFPLLNNYQRRQLAGDRDVFWQPAVRARSWRRDSVDSLLNDPPSQLWLGGIAFWFPSLKKKGAEHVCKGQIKGLPHTAAIISELPFEPNLTFTLPCPEL